MHKYNAYKIKKKEINNATNAAAEH